MKRTGKWIIGIVLTATAGFVAVQNGFSPASIQHADYRVRPLAHHLKVPALTSGHTMTRLN